MRIILSIALCVSLTACVVRLADLEKTPTDRKLEFSGSHIKLSQCAQYRGLDGKVRTDPVGKRVIIFDSVKNLSEQGITHYAMIFAQVTEARGIVEFKKKPVGPMDVKTLKRFWSPVEGCVKDLASRKSS